MKVYALILLVIGSALAEPLEKSLFYQAVSESSSRIVGGQPARRGEFPYQISYQMNGQHICGGSILTSNWILTAGHCVVGSTSNTLVVAGLLNQRENHPDVQILRIQRQIIHSQYPGGVAPNDIALLQLSGQLRWSNAVQPISLPRENQEFSGLAWVSGWGYLTSANPVTPTALQKVQLRVQNYQGRFLPSANSKRLQNTLTSLIGSSYPLDNTMICLVGPYTGRETVCQGDSGGPVMQNGILLGVASWTLNPCGTYRAPSVYTKVSKHIRFIRQYVPGV